MDLLSSKCKIIIESVSLRSRFMPHTTSLSTTHSHTLTHKLPHTCDTSATRLQRGARLSRHGHVGRALLVGSPCGVWVCAVWVGGRAHSAAAPRSAGEQHSARGISPSRPSHSPPLRGACSSAGAWLAGLRLKRVASDFDQLALQGLSSQRHACLRPVRGSGQPRPISRLAGHTGLAFDILPAFTWFR